MHVAQRYISNPYLIGGKKFDIRLYCLVSNFSPLTIYQYRGGFCRFTSTRYKFDVNEISNTFMHLTNVAVQKVSDTYNKEVSFLFFIKHTANLN
jgi:tubulin polyglutamylase TTLL9